MPHRPFVVFHNPNAAIVDVSLKDSGHGWMYRLRGRVDEQWGDDRDLLSVSYMEPGEGRGNSYWQVHTNDVSAIAVRTGRSTIAFDLST